MKHFAAHILAIVLITVTAGPAVAQCSLELTDIRDEPASVTSASPNRRVYRFKAVSRPGSYDTTLFMNTAGAGLGGHIIGCDAPSNPSQCIREMYCVPPGAWEIWALATCDGLVERKMLPFEVPDVGPDVAITGVVRLPDGRYRADTLFTLPIGQWPMLSSYSVEHRLPDGTYSSPVPSETNVLTAVPGDRVGIAVSVCNDYQRFVQAYAVISAPPSVEVAVFDGDGQRAVIGEPAEKSLRVKFTASDPALDLRTLSAVFEVVSTPSNATGQGVGATETTIAQTYSAPVAADGTAAATIVAGSVAGPYVVRVKSLMSLTGAEARFTTTALKPDGLAILKDSTDVSDAAGSYAVSASAATKFYAVGTDVAGEKIGPMKCTWSVSASGNPSTRGDGTLSPISPARTVIFQPAKVGKLKLAANPVLPRVRGTNAELFVTGLYLSVGTFDTANPVDDLGTFVPGSNRDGTSVPVANMPQKVTLHVLTGGSSRGFVTFQLEDVSAYPGIAMNWPINNPDTGPDLALEHMALQQDSTMRVPFSGSGDTSVSILLRDYAAKGRLRVTVESGKNTYSLPAVRLPADGNGNSIPDRGWHALANSATGELNHVNDVHAPSSDGDNDPVATGLPANGITGDGLSALEEYRGFIVRGAHRRLHPLRKDLFVVVIPRDDTFTVRLTELPLTIHKIRQNEAAGEFAPVINPNRGSVPGASLQRAVFVRNRTDPPMYQRDDGIVSADFEARGWTFQEGDNLDLIDGSMAGLALVQSPNETLVSESFDFNFWRHYISYSDNAARDTQVAPTDVNYPQYGAIYGGDNWLQSQPNSLNASGDDFQTAAIFTICGSSANRPWRPMTVDEVVDAYRNTLLHEAAHGVDVEHDRAECSSSIMSDEAAVPVQRSLTANDHSQIRIHRKHN